jgi:hypothetical protein
LGSYWHKIPESREIEDVTLHYLEGKIKVDLLLPLSVLRGDVNKQQQLKQAFDQVTEQVSEVDSINLIFH